MALLMPALGDLAVETGQRCLKLTPPRIGEHLLEDVDVLTHMVEHVHTSSRVIQHEATHRVLDQGLELPQSQTVGQVSVRAQEGTRGRCINAARFDKLMPATENIQVALRKNLVIGGRSLEAEGDPETEDALDRRIRRLRNVAGGIRQMTTEQLRNVACCGQVIRSCRGRSRALIHRKSLLFELTQHHISG